MWGDQTDGRLRDGQSDPEFQVKQINDFLLFVSVRSVMMENSRIWRMKFF